MIRVKNLTKFFGRKKAVDDLNFKVTKGEIMGFLGPNGAGKTTTMRLMTGFIYPDQGDVVINNQSVKEYPIEVKKQIGYLPENNPLYTEMLVSEFLKLSAQLKNIPHQDFTEAIDFAVTGTNIEDVYYQPIKQLSKGYKQRVGLAATLLHQPKILILDEPTEGLDPNQREQIRSLIRKLAKNHTIIMSTHVMQEVSATCTRILIINQGKIVADGSKEEILSKAGGEKVVKVVIEGKKVKSSIKSIPEIELVSSNSIAINTLEIKIKCLSDLKIERKIAKLAQKNDWMILEMSTDQQDLEKLFYSLTK